MTHTSDTIEGGGKQWPWLWMINCYTVIQIWIESTVSPRCGFSDSREWPTEIILQLWWVIEVNPWVLELICRVLSVCLLTECGGYSFGEESDDKGAKLLKRWDLWLVSIMPLVTKHGELMIRHYHNCSNIPGYSCWRAGIPIAKLYILLKVMTVYCILKFHWA